MRLLRLKMPAEIERFVKGGQTAGFIPIIHIFQMQSNLSAHRGYNCFNLFSVYQRSLQNILINVPNLSFNFDNEAKAEIFVNP